MQPLFPRRNRYREPLLRRLDHAAGQINPFLAMIAIGLAVLDAACLIALIDTGSLAIHRGDAGTAVSASAANTAPHQ